MPHLILGRPWQFDEGVWYDGHANAYIVEWKGKKLRLVPTHANEKETAVAETSVFIVVSSSEILHDYKGRSDLLVILITCNTSIESSSTTIPPSVSKLL